MGKYHLIGIGGIGMSGLARILHESKSIVSGSDASDGHTVQELRNSGIVVSIGHDAVNVPVGAEIVYSSGISAANPELKYAKDSQLTVLHRSDLLNLLMQNSKPLLVTGTHGKTTTSSLLTSVLIHCGVDPSYALGGILKDSNLNAKKGAGPHFVAEADESDGSFLRYTSFGAIITNIGLDHMDHYKTEDNLLASFKQFSEKVESQDHLFYCGENERLKSLKLKGISYGFSSDCQLKGSNFRQVGWKVIFDVEFDGHFYPNVEVTLSGYHNALNALAVFGLTLRLGLKESLIREGLKNFQGVKRRGELKGEVCGVQVFDDYGHHPTEIRATLRAIKNAMPNRRLVVLFQPHRYSRTRDCLDQFFTSFDAADEVVLTDIYAASESPIPGIHAKSILEGLKIVSARYIPKENLLEGLTAFIKPLDTVVTMGAGNIWQTGEALVDRLKKDPLKKIKIGLLFGGKSTEHEISLKSAKNVLNGLDPTIYDPSLFFISKQGVWVKVKEIAVPEVNVTKSITADVLAALNECDIVFPVLHGPNGEDGTMQGFLEIMNIPYVGCNHQSSAICMDKAVTKKLVALAGLSVVPYVDFSRNEWKKDPSNLIQKIFQNLEFPLYVKPVHLGSSVGVTRVKTERELIEAVNVAFSYDDHVLVEKEMKGREIEFAVFGGSDVMVLPPGEVLNNGEVYSYEAKYGTNSFSTTSKADLLDEIIQKGMVFAKRSYMASGCDGFARVDCFLDENNQYYLNEINTIPGFTEISLYPKMCKTNGYLLSQILNELISIGFLRDTKKRQTL